MTSERDITEPLDEARAAAPRQFALRFPDQLLARIDARAESVGLSRNAWLEKAADWVLTYLPTGIPHPDRDRVATEAPQEVAGTGRLPAPGFRYGARKQEAEKPTKSKRANGADHVHTWVRKGSDTVCLECGEVQGF